jgi:hypothetical protein
MEMRMQPGVQGVPAITKEFPENCKIKMRMKIKMKN